MLHKRRLLVSALVASIAAFGLSAVAWAQQQGTPYYPHMGPMMGGGWWMIFGPLMMIVMIAAIIVLVVLAVRWLGGPSHGTMPRRSSEDTPLDILRSRFARGEIDEKEFKERRRILED